MPNTARKQIKTEKSGKGVGPNQIALSELLKGTKIDAKLARRRLRKGYPKHSGSWAFSTKERNEVMKIIKG